MIDAVMCTLAVTFKIHPKQEKLTEFQEIRRNDPPYTLLHTQNTDKMWVKMRT